MEICSFIFKSLVNSVLEVYRLFSWGWIGVRRLRPVYTYVKLPDKASYKTEVTAAFLFSTLNRKQQRGEHQSDYNNNQ